MDEEHEATEPDPALEIRRLFRIAWLVVGALIVGIFVWGAGASISGAVIAPGKLAVEGRRKAIQHLDGGVVRSLEVRDGDLVEANGLLATLDATEIDAELDGARRELIARKSQLDMVEAELASLSDLFAKRLVTQGRMTALQREAATATADIARLEGQRARLEGRKSRLAIRSPVKGRVLNLVAHTIGGVIGPNATIAEIVPAGDGLVVEARVAPSDIDQLHAGQRARVRMTSLNQRVTPILDGRLERVSADLMREENTNRDYYLARVVLAENATRHLGGKTLVPGMPAEVLVETGRRSALSYLTKPLMDQFARAFREE